MRTVFRKLADDTNYIFLCAEIDGKIVGTIQGIVCYELYGECNPFLVMENFVVDAQYRQKGIGRMLLNELESIGKERKCSQIIFITETQRRDAVEFYQKMGFDPTSHAGFKKSLEQKQVMTG